MLFSTCAIHRGPATYGLTQWRYIAFFSWAINEEGLKGEEPVVVNHARFLDYAAERIFLQKVGGGYIFVHRTLLEHFAQ